jgi:2-keto-3-deoxy-L-rhamnonate aldolase RhmA
MTFNFRQRLRAGERLVGMIVSLAAPEVTEILGLAGFDWLFLDAEHSPLDSLSLQRLMQGAGAATPCVVRLAAGEEIHVKKALDSGAAGIIAPMVNSAEHAARVVRWARYAPAGTRGVGLARAHGYGLDFGDYMSNANARTAVIVQAEHIQAVENMAGIVQVPDLDAVFVGPYDLSASMGLPGQVDHPDVKAAIGRVTETCQAAGMPLGIFGMSAEALRPWLAQGYTLVVAGVDAHLLAQSAQRLAAELKE